MKKLYYVLTVLVCVLMLFSCVIKINNPPNKPINLQPSNGAKNVPINVTLKWEATDPDGDTLKFDLYFGNKEDPPIYKSGLTSNSYELENLKNNRTYYWKVVAKDPKGKTEAGDVWRFTTIPPEGEDIEGSFLVVEYQTGHAVEDAVVIIKSGDEVLVEDVTDEKGEVTFNLSGFSEKIDVELKKQGYALSKIEGLKVEDIVDNFKEVQLRTSKLSTDPDSQTFPKVTLTFFDLDGIELDTSNITENFILRVDVETDNHPSSIYAKIGSVPGSGFLDNYERELASDTKTATFTMDISNFEGEVPLYVVFYDKNDNRVEKIEYITITKEIEEVEENLFVPIADSVSLWAWTRNQGVEFYSRDKIIEIASEKFDTNKNSNLSQNFDPLKNFGKGLEAAPKGTNLWIEISWVDYDTLDESGLIDPNVIRPDGYNVYRSFDGDNYRKIATVGSGYYLDPSAQNAPGKEVWYAVTSYRGTEESELVALGSVVPLDSFNVNLKSPADRATNVSRQPTFVWKPTKELTSPESDVEYYYTMWIYDLVQSENYIFPGILVDDLYMYDFATVGATEVSVTFKGIEGSPGYEYLTWFLYLPSTIDYYEDNKLEPGKTYDWGVDYAYAVSYDSDSLAISIAIDYVLIIDPLGGVMPEIHNEFTTGE